MVSESCSSVQVLASVVALKILKGFCEQQGFLAFKTVSVKKLKTRLKNCTYVIYEITFNLLVGYKEINGRLASDRPKGTQEPPEKQRGTTNQGDNLLRTDAIHTWVGNTKPRRKPTTHICITHGDNLPRTDALHTGREHLTTETTCHAQMQYTLSVCKKLQIVQERDRINHGKIHPDVRVWVSIQLVLVGRECISWRENTTLVTMMEWKSSMLERIINMLCVPPKGNLHSRPGMSVICHPAVASFRSQADKIAAAALY
ncbi:hypothetical protein MAR_014236 [Mya arenaria]|uniref:Uncharacterized protein n=1 Tax=Mya arenaria TaxID=6604 RepID=A0ABY7G3Q5_MYAAR|nr:hypothetical protein MAR_014236 [Mya arenaria]